MRGREVLGEPWHAPRERREGKHQFLARAARNFYFFFSFFFRKKADDLWRVLSKKPKRTSCLPQGFVPAAAPLLARLRAVVLRPRRAHSGLLRRALAAGFLVVVCCVFFFFFPLEEGYSEFREHRREQKCLPLSLLAPKGQA